MKILRVCVCVCTHSLAWSLAAYRTLTTAVSVSVFTVREHTAESIHTRSVTQYSTVILLHGSTITISLLWEICNDLFLI